MIASKVWLVELKITIGSYEETTFVHLASDFFKAMDWIKENGDGWSEEDYKFAVFSPTIDKGGIYEDYEDITFFDKKGNLLEIEMNDSLYDKKRMI